MIKIFLWLLVAVILIAQSIRAVDNAEKVRKVTGEKERLEARVKYLESMVVESNGSITLTWEESENVTIP